jgi:hypothetical protein
MPSSTPLPPPAPEAQAGCGTFLLVMVADAGAEGGTDTDLSVYRTRSARMLCVVEDPDTACDTGLTFLRVPGPAAAAR